MKKILILIGVSLLFGCASQSRVDSLQEDMNYAAIKIIENEKVLKKLEQKVDELESRVTYLQGSNYKFDREIISLIDEVKHINSSMNRLFLKFNQK